MKGIDRERERETEPLNPSNDIGLYGAYIKGRTFRPLTVAESTGNHGESSPRRRPPPTRNLRRPK